MERAGHAGIAGEDFLARFALAGWTLRALVAGPEPTRDGKPLAASLARLAVKLRDPGSCRMIRASSA